MSLPLDAADAPPNPVPARGFRRLAMILLGSLVIMGCVAGGVAFGLYHAATASVPAYEAVVEVDPQRAEKQRREFESQLSALVSDSQSLPQWSTRLTDNQVNAWLALRIERDFPGFQRAGLHSPRVIFDEGAATFAARSNLNGLEGVVSVTLRPSLTATDDLALEIVAAKIGRLSLPLDAVMGQLRRTPLADVGAIRLSPSGQSAAILLDLERIDLGRDRSLRLTGLALRDGELLLSGEGGVPQEPRPSPPAATER